MDINPKPATAPPKFLVCVDQHEESQAALRFACLKAITRGAIVDIIHILPPADFQTLGIIADRMSEERRSEGEALLRKLSEEAQRRYGISPGLILREGSAGDELLKVLSEMSDVSVLIVGTAHHMKGRGKLASWLAQQLGQKLFIPLLMVPGNLTEDQIRVLM
ncbi:MAG: universal stress protein [Alphaproteobacteria bacterium]|nr:universal stress protein [Alphaproteobacteria bacterium]